MNIGIYHPDLSSTEAAGGYVFLRNIVQAMPDRHTVSIFTKPGGSADRLERANTDIKFLEWPGRDDVSARHAVQELVDAARTYFNIERRNVLETGEYPVDVLLTQNVTDTLLLSNIVDIPIAHLFHSVQRVGLASNAMKRFADDVSYIANSTTTELEIRDKIGVHSAGIVPPGVDRSTFTPDADPAFDRDEATILFVGRLIESKGVYDLLEAVSALNTECNLCIVGGGDRERVTATATRLGISDKVDVLGRVPHDELPRYYSACDLFCLPTYYETFGMANLEAMACGMPVLTTDIPGVSDYATHRETCYLVPPGDINELVNGLETLFSRPELRAELGKNGLDVADRYSWRESATDLVTVLERIIDDRSQRNTMSAVD